MQAYKMRTALAKSLQTRSNAIRTAVRKYNEAALRFDPPKPIVDWSKVTHYSFLEEFDLLRLSRNDFSTKLWANTAIRDTMRQYQKILRAREEITRCTIEVRRLHTSIVNEQRHLRNVLSTLCDDPMYGYMEDHVIRRRRVNDVICAHIAQIYDLEGFTGDKTPGTRKGCMPQTTRPLIDDVDLLLPQNLGVDSLDGDEDEAGASDTEVAELNHLVEFLSISDV